MSTPPAIGDRVRWIAFGGVVREGRVTGIVSPTMVIVTCNDGGGVVPTCRLERLMPQQGELAL